MLGLSVRFSKNLRIAFSQFGKFPGDWNVRIVLEGVHLQKLPDWWVLILCERLCQCICSCVFLLASYSNTVFLHAFAISSLQFANALEFTWQSCSSCVLQKSWNTRISVTRLPFSVCGFLPSSSASPLSPRISLLIL